MYKNTLNSKFSDTVPGQNIAKSVLRGRKCRAKTIINNNKNRLIIAVLTARFTEVDVDSLQLQIRSTTAATSRVYAMLVRYHLPELRQIKSPIYLLFTFIINFIYRDLPLIKRENSFEFKKSRISFIQNMASIKKDEFNRHIIPVIKFY